MPLFKITSLISDKHGPRVAYMLDDITAHVITDPVDISPCRASRCCIPSGVASLACSAIVQQFMRGKPASKPSTNPRARRRGSTLRKRGPMRTITPSSNPSQGDTGIVAYCRGRYCVLAPDAVQLLRERGYAARPLADGRPGWRRAGLPVSPRAA